MEALQVHFLCFQVASNHIFMYYFSNFSRALNLTQKNGPPRIHAEKETRLVKSASPKMPFPVVGDRILKESNKCTLYWIWF